MKRLLFSLLGVAVLNGCATGLVQTAGMTAYDGVSAEYPGEARLLAENAAAVLADRYPPGRTSLALVRAPGLFGEELETALRGRGFALCAPDGPGVRVGYILDRVRDEATPTGYLQMTTSDGGRFGFARKLHSGSAPAAPAVASASPAVDVTPLPDPGPQSAPETALISAPAPVSPGRTTPDVPPSGAWPVRSTSTARAIARRNHVSVENFCAWNKVTPGETIPKGTYVSLREPTPAPAAKTADDAVAPVPAPTVTQPSAAAASRASAVPVPVQTPTPEPVNKALAELTPSDPEMALKTAEPLPEQWAIQPGGLQDQLGAWCGRAGYRLVWKAAHDYQLEAHAAFKGTFLGSIRKLFSGLHKHGVPLRVTLYEDNKVLEVVEE